MCVDIILSSIGVAEWPPSGGDTHSIDHMIFFVFGLFVILVISYFWFRGLDLGSDCFSLWSLHTFNIQCIENLISPFS